MHKKIILASSSPRRKDLLDAINLDYEIDPATKFNEIPQSECLAHELVEINSKGKAKEVAARHENAIIIGADTVGSYKDTILEKPKNDEDAFRMMKLYQGNTHEVFTGLCIIDTETGKEIYEMEVTEIEFEPLTDDEICKYIAKCEAHDKAAAYAIQGFGSLFVKEIRGDYFNVVGLPMHRLYHMMKSFDMNLLDIVK